MAADLPSRIGPYRVVELIGKAGSSAVYKAEAPSGHPVAVKLFPARLTGEPATVERFHSVLGQADPVTNHPNLVRIFQTGQEGDRLFLALELIEGTSLDRVLKARRLSVPESLAVAKGICRGLAHAHQHGILHLGLKPRGVLVSPDLATVKVGDLGAAAFESVTNLTGTISTGEISLGGLYYLAPEQVEGGAGSGKVDHRADLYAAGVILHEMLTGRPPGPRFGLPSQLNPELTPDVDVLVLKCLAKKPSERFATALDLLNGIANLEEVLRLRLASQIRGISQGKARPLLLFLGLAVLVLAVLAGAWLLLR
jgi:serine/threonine-protein kinase